MKNPRRMFIASSLLTFAFLVAAAWDGFSGRPLINPELGDVALFIFVISGALAGFVTGYALRRYKTSNPVKSSKK